MSDFLNKFETDYDGETIIDGTKEQQTNSSLSNEDLVRTDNEYKNKQKKKKFIYMASGIAITLLLVVIYVLVNLVNVPDFSNKSVAEAKSWSQQKNINLNLNEEFSTKIDENNIVSQNKKVGSKIFKKNTIILVVSKGANPDEKITIPNLLYMNIGEIEQWKETNKLDNVVIEAVSSNKEPEGKVLNINYDGDFVNASNYYRRDTMIIKVSKGKPGIVKNIVVPDFTDSDKHDVKDWADEYNVMVSYQYQGHPKKPKNGIIKQSVKKNTKISGEQGLTVFVSLGKGKVVPNFKNMTQERASEMFGNAVIKTKYNDYKPYGGFISQSIRPGTTIYDNTKVTIYYSEGKPFIGNLKGKTRKEVIEFIYQLNLKGADLDYQFAKEPNKGKYSDVEHACVTRTDPQNGFILTSETVWVYIK